MQRVNFNGTELFDRRFNTGDDLKGKAHTLTIIKTEPVMVHTQKGEEQKYAIHFKEAKRPFILNKQFAESIAAALGQFDASKWAMQRITIYPVASRNGGDTVLARKANETPETVVAE